MKSPPEKPDELPPADIKRWSARRKVAVLDAIFTGKMTVGDAYARWGLTGEKVAAWQWAYGLHGLAGLRALRIQRYRRALRAQSRREASERGDPEDGDSSDSDLGHDRATAVPVGAIGALSSPRSKSSSRSAPVITANGSIRWCGSGDRVSYFS
jgi:hypothetical protein